MNRPTFSQYAFLDNHIVAEYNFQTGNRGFHGNDHAWRGSRKATSLRSRSNRRKAQRRHK